jgi:hypothetical protein
MENLLKCQGISAVQSHRDFLRHWRAASAPYNGDCNGDKQAGRGLRQARGASDVAEPNLSGFARSESQQSGDGCHQDDACLVLVLVRERERERSGGGGRTRSSHTRGAQVRVWTPHLMCFDNGDRIRKGWAMAGRQRGSEVTQFAWWPPSALLRNMMRICASRKSPAEAAGGLEWTGRWPGASISEISHLHRAGIMTMSRCRPPQFAVAVAVAVAVGDEGMGTWGPGPWGGRMGRGDLKHAHKIWNG